MFELEINGENKVQIGKNIQLTGTCITSNDMASSDTETGEVSRENCTNIVTWPSSNEKVATIDESGKITGVSKGKTIIHGVWNNNWQKDFEVEVIKSAIYFYKATDDSPFLLKNKSGNVILGLEGIPDSEKKI